MAGRDGRKNSFIGVLLLDRFLMSVGLFGEKRIPRRCVPAGSYRDLLGIC